MPSILIIDDDSNIRKSVRFYLEKELYDVIEAENGKEAMALFDARKPDLVLLDLHMPVMDGFDVLKTITARSADTAVIAVSGNDAVGDAVKALEQGAWDYLLKPIHDFKVLIHAVEKGLERSRLVIENRTCRERIESMVAQRTRELEERVAQRDRELEKKTAQLEKAEKAADTAAETKRSFLANISHEIRTPLNGVIGAADLALQEDIPEKVVNYLRVIQSSGHTLLRILNDILDFSKIKSEKSNLEIVTFDLGHLIDNVVAQFSYQAYEKDIELLLDMPFNIPYHYQGDALRIEQILIILVGNAIKFTNNFGTVALGISESQERSERSDRRFVFFVKDTGIGMPAEQQDKLFLPFSQMDSSTTRLFSGTGLGLSICKQLVIAMGGEIWVKSTPGIGTTFYFAIDLEAREEKKEEEIDPVLLDMTTLLVGVKSAGIEALSKYLKYFQHKIITAASGKDALSILKEYRKKARGIDLIIFDGDDRDSDGLAAAKLIRENIDMDTALIVTTVPNSEMDRKASDIDKLCTILYKPVTPRALVASLKNAFSFRPRKTQEAREEEKRQQPEQVNLLTGLKVLVAEDNVINQQIAVAILENAGIKATVAKNGKEAVDALRFDPYDAVLMDIQMPEMDGYEATAKIRRELGKTDLPIIAMTADALKGTEAKCLAAGMDGYITKPVARHKLLDMLREKAGPKVKDA